MLIVVRTVSIADTRWWRVDGRIRQFLYDDTVGYNHILKYGHLVSPAGIPSKLRTDLTLGTTRHGMHRAFRNYTLSEPERWASDNIELLAVSMCSFWSERIPSMDDLVTQTFEWWLIEAEFSCRSLRSTARSVATIVATTFTTEWRAP